MRRVKCSICDTDCIKYGKTKAGSQRWFCKHCSVAFTEQINTDAKELQLFLKRLFGKQTEAEMIGKGRTFRRKTAKFWFR